MEDLGPEVVALDAIGVVQEVQGVVDGQPEARPPADDPLPDLRREADLADLLEHLAGDGQQTDEGGAGPVAEHDLQRALQGEDVRVEAGAGGDVGQEVLDVVELARLGQGGAQGQDLLAEEEPLLVVEHGLYGYSPRNVVASATRDTASM